MIDMNRPKRSEGEITIGSPAAVVFD